MKVSELVSRTETYVKEVMSQQEGTLTIAHDFKHVDRVRNLALIIANGEEFPDLEIVELTALLHDVGLSQIKNGNEEEGHVILPPHGPLGAEIASKFLRENSRLNNATIELIIDVIRHHSDSPLKIAEHLQTLGDKGKLTEIIRDADATDAMGAVGIMRAFTSKHFLPEYNPGNIKGNNWGLAPLSSGFHPVNNIVDQINQQSRYYDNLHTRTAKLLAEPLVHFMKDFVIQLEREIDCRKTP
jgi:uncharacterized protein